MPNNLEESSPNKDKKTVRKKPKLRLVLHISLTLNITDSNISLLKTMSSRTNKKANLCAAEM